MVVGWPNGSAPVLLLAGTVRPWMLAYMLRNLPTRESVRRTWAYPWFGESLMGPVYWTPGRHSLALGLGIGWFLGLLPCFGLHRRLVVLAGALLRCHLPTAVLGTFISNPLTWPAILMVQYLAGGWIYSFFGDPNAAAPWPQYLGSFVATLTMGSLVTATLMGISGYVGAWLFWNRIAE
jgi:uncharacterized protein (DUF2062 family)